MDDEHLPPPKLFISYSWSSPNHEAWVLKFATDLSESGIDVVFDKWALREGHDANEFMEKMVTDPAIEKVVLVCNRSYAEKADARSGGVGTEAQIISPEIYEKQDQEKFVAVVTERDENDKPLVPTYYRSRIHIDLSDTATYADNFEQLLRWVFDKPLHIKPAIGRRPAFLDASDTSVRLGSSVEFRQAVEAIRNGRNHAIPAIGEYFDRVAAGFETFRLPDNPSDDDVVTTIKSFLPQRDDIVELFRLLSVYVNTDETPRILHCFFERLIPFLTNDGRPGSHTTWEFDHYRFIVHELFLYCIAQLIKDDRFDLVSDFLNKGYYTPGHPQQVRDYGAFWNNMDSLHHRNKRLKLDRMSIRADLLKERCRGLEISFRELMQADFLLFLRDSIRGSTTLSSWYPVSLIYFGGYQSPFEIFARSRSKSYFDKVKEVIGVPDKETLEKVLEEFSNGTRRKPHWDIDSFNPSFCCDIEHLATMT